MTTERPTHTPRIRTCQTCGDTRYELEHLCGSALYSRDKPTTYDRRPCGCYVDEDSRIVYCPTHAAAPEPRVLLEEFWTLWHTTRANPGSPCYHQPRSACDESHCASARALLARIEGTEVAR